MKLTVYTQTSSYDIAVCVSSIVHHVPRTATNVMSASLIMIITATFWVRVLEHVICVGLRCTYCRVQRLPLLESDD